MFIRTKICAALFVAVAANAWAQDAAPESTQRVEITGSSIRRIQGEGALPVTVISREAIDKTGVTSVTELIQELPAMTGLPAILELGQRQRRRQHHGGHPRPGPEVHAGAARWPARRPLRRLRLRGR